MKAQKLFALLALLMLAIFAFNCALADEATPGEGTECDHDYQYHESSETSTPTSDGASTHSYKVTVTSYEECTKCYNKISEKTDVQTKTEAHSFNNGSCGVCNYNCPHSTTHFVPAGGNYSYTSNGASGHTVDVTNYIEVEECNICVSVVKTTEPTSKTYDEAHSYVVNGDVTECRKCGYQNECSHPSYEENLTFISDLEFKPKDANTHYVTGYVRKSFLCTECGAKVKPDEEPADEVTEVADHWFENGVCVACGYIKVTATPTPAPSSSSNSNSNSSSTNNAMPAPTATPVPAVVVPPVVSNLFNAIDNAQLQNRNAVIHIVGAEQLLTQEEYTSLNTLTPKEQILVTLASIGLDDVVESAIAALETPLSASGSALIEEITARMIASTPEERAAIEETLATYFPIEEIEIDGVTVTYFVIELSIEIDGVETIQRFGFRQDDDGNWVLDDLTTIAADADQAEAIPSEPQSDANEDSVAF